MNALGFALRHPLTILVAVTAIALGSLFSVNRMRTDVFPDLNRPVVTLMIEASAIAPTHATGETRLVVTLIFPSPRGRDNYQ